MAHWLYDFVVFSPESPTIFIRSLLTTSSGHKLILVGSAIGLLFGIVVLTTSVVAFPLLLDRDVSAATALATSIRAVLANPVTMTLWGSIVAAGLVIGSLCFL